VATILPMLQPEHDMIFFILMLMMPHSGTALAAASLWQVLTLNQNSN